MTTNNANLRTFGIELEVYLPTSVQVQLGQYHRGQQIDGLPQGWNAQSDSSITTYAPQGFYGVEVVSPVLAGENGLEQVVDVVNAITEAGGIVNDHCGFHIHVGALDFNQADIDNLVKEFRCYQNVFLALNGEKANSRTDNRYCKMVLNNSSVYTDRYFALNIQNWRSLSSSKKTVELRVMAGTLDIETIFTSILAFVGLVCKAKMAPRQHRVKTMTPADFINNIMSRAEYQITELDNDYSLFFEKIQPSGIF
jgi:hypothetical protein